MVRRLCFLCHNPLPDHAAVRLLGTTNGYVYYTTDGVEEGEDAEEVYSPNGRPATLYFCSEEHCEEMQKRYDILDSSQNISQEPVPAHDLECEEHETEVLGGMGRGIESHPQPKL